MAHRFIIVANPDILIELKPDYTVEAEYGDICVEGKLGTLAHHGPRSGNPAPCSMHNYCCVPRHVVYTVDEGPKSYVFGLSHFDLDTFGGILAILGIKPEYSGFWNLAAFVDINGAHKIQESDASELEIEQLYAWWAYIKPFRYMPKGDEVLDISSDIPKHIENLNKILQNDEELLKAGRKLRNDELQLNLSSYVENFRNLVVIRFSTTFVNHLYTLPNGLESCKACLSFNMLTGAVTLSFANDIGMSACEILQKVFGEKAGGHKTIAGSPRGERVSLRKFREVYEELIEATNTLTLRNSWSKGFEKMRSK